MWPVFKIPRDNHLSQLANSIAGGRTNVPLPLWTPPQNGNNSWQSSGPIRWGFESVTALRTYTLIVAGIAGLTAMQPLRVSAEWWSRAPADFEECADAADKLVNKETKTAALAECNAKFAGRRKAGGGYSYYDFMQDRTFDIAGPNPTPDEQKYIDQQYTVYLESQRRNNIAAELAERQQRALQEASLQSEPERGPIPVPQERPTRQAALAPPVQLAPTDARSRAKPNCAKSTSAFSCQWPKLSESINELKKLFSGPAPSKAKRS
jgi:hypothetical protein